MDLIFTRDRAFYFTTVFIPGIILVTSSFITFWLEWNAVPARSMIGNDGGKRGGVPEELLSDHSALGSVHCPEKESNDLPLSGRINGFWCVLWRQDKDNRGNISRAINSND